MKIIDDITQSSQWEIKERTGLVERNFHCSTQDDGKEVIVGNAYKTRNGLKAIILHIASDRYPVIGYIIDENLQEEGWAWTACGKATEHKSNQLDLMSMWNYEDCRKGLVHRWRHITDNYYICMHCTAKKERSNREQQESNSIPPERPMKKSEENQLHLEKELIREMIKPKDDGRKINDTVAYRIVPEKDCAGGNISRCETQDEPNLLKFRCNSCNCEFYEKKSEEEKKKPKKQTLLEYSVNKFSRDNLIKNNFSAFAILRTISEYLEQRI